MTTIEIIQTDTVLESVQSTTVIEIGTVGAAGTNGIDGIDGSLWLNGSGIPANSLGNDNDNYTNNDNSDTYHKTAGVWNLTGNIQGDQGIQGIPGNDNLLDGSTSGQLAVWDNDQLNYIPIDITDAKWDNVNKTFNVGNTLFVDILKRKIGANTTTLIEDFTIAAAGQRVDDIPTMTGNNTPASHTIYSNLTPANAWKSFSDDGQWLNGDATALFADPGYVELLVLLPAPKIYTTVTLKAGITSTTDDMPKDFTIQARNGGSWDIILTKTDQVFSSGEQKEYDMGNIAPYTEYGLFTTATSDAGDIFTLVEMEFFEAKSFSDVMTIGAGGEVKFLDNIPSIDARNQSIDSINPQYKSVNIPGVSETYHETTPDGWHRISPSGRVLDIEADLYKDSVKVTEIMPGSILEEIPFFNNAKQQYEPAGIWPDNTIPLMTSATAPEGTASASSESTTYVAYKAMNRSAVTSRWISLTDTDEWIAYEHTASKTIIQVDIQCPNQVAQAPKDFIIEGGDGFDLLGTYINQTDWIAGEWRSFTLEVTGSYAKYRIYINNSNNPGGVVSIANIRFIEDTARTKTLFYDQENGDIESTKYIKSAISHGAMYTTISDDLATTGISGTSGSYSIIKPMIAKYQSGTDYVTYDITDGTFTIGANGGGLYQVHVGNLSCNSSAPANFTFAIFVNGAEEDSIMNDRKLSNANDDGVQPLSGIIDLSAGDIVDFRIKPSINTTMKLTYFNFNLYRIGR